MRRRQFITGLAGVAAWPLAGRAQQQAIPVVGYLSPQYANDDFTVQVLQSLKETGYVVGQNVAVEYRYAENEFDRLPALAADLVHRRVAVNEAGFVEGRNVTIEFRWAENQLDRLSGLAADLVRRQVTVITANATATLSTKAATATIPIVFVSGDDPGDVGLVTNLSRPGGNLTGVSFSNGPLNPKRFQLLHELVSKSTTIAVIFDPNSPTPDARLRDIEAGAHTLGRDILILKAGTENEVNAAFVSITQSGAGALFVAASPSFIGRRHQITALALRHGLPASYPSREFAEIGGLMSYGASPIDAYRRGGVYVSRILKGEKPGDLPVELPTKYELVVNIATAKALGLTIPETLLATADEVIQ